MGKHLGQCQLPGEGSFKVPSSTAQLGSQLTAWPRALPGMLTCWSLLHNHLERGLCSPSSCIHAQAPSHSALRPLRSLPFSASSPLTELHVSQPPQGLTWEFATSQACSSFAPNLTAFSFCSPLPPCPRSPHTSGEFQGVDSSFPPVSGPFWTLLLL